LNTKIKVENKKQQFSHATLKKFTPSDKLLGNLFFAVFCELSQLSLFFFFIDC